MSPRKTKKKTIKSPASGMATLPSASPGGNKWIVRGLLAVVAVFCVVEAFNFSNSEAVKDYKVQSILMIDGNNTKCGPFNVWGVGFVGKDKIMAVDHGNNRVLVFDRQGNCIRNWGKIGSGPMQFHEPSGMTTDDKGNGYIMDTWNGTIKAFNEFGKELKVISLGSGNFYGPRGLSFDGHNFAIADTGSHRLAIVSMDGKMEASWGGFGRSKGQFKGLLDVACDPKGGYLVADSENNRLQWLDEDGKVKKVFNYKSGVPSVAADKDGRFFVSTGNGVTSLIKAYDPNGNYLGDLRDEKGSLVPGDSGLAVGPGDVLMVAGGTHIALYQLPPATP